MQVSMSTPLQRFPCCVLLLLAVAGCEREATPEEQLTEAARDVEAVEQQVIEASEDIMDSTQQLNERRRAVREAEKALARARRELRRLQDELTSESQRLQSKASDVAIFRLVQKHLMEEPELQDTTISAHVSDGVVTLQGQGSKRDAALANGIAAAAPGVVDVRNLIDVTDEDSEHQ